MSASGTLHSLLHIIVIHRLLAPSSFLVQPVSELLTNSLSGQLPFPASSIRPPACDHNRASFHRKLTHHAGRGPIGTDFRPIAEPVARSLESSRTV
ncbi:MAG TPA: hypothetical protein DCE43_08290 [Planctomycetaceae bacterium]|nr:hypothetical protein [Planctomycetaceae bacterium]